MSKKLTDKQQAFIDEYLIDLNATKAAMRAGYSEETAQQIGSENLSKPVIQKAIQEAQKERREANKVTRESISKEIDTLVRTAKTIALEGNPTALTSWAKALETKAKLYGLFDVESQPTPNDVTKIERVIVDVVDARKPIYDSQTGELLNHTPTEYKGELFQRGN